MHLIYGTIRFPAFFFKFNGFFRILIRPRKYFHMVTLIIYNKFSAKKFDKTFHQ